MPSNDFDDFESLANQVLADIPTGSELVRLGPRPLFIEFCGTPKSGKTTCADRLRYFLNRNGFQVTKVVERAGVCPLRNKHHPSFNVWTACTSLTQILEEKEKDSQIVILDRGLFDALCWMNFMELTGRLTAHEKEKMFSFFLLERWRSLIDIVFVMVTTPREAIRREFDGQLTQREGSIMNERNLQLVNQAIELTYNTMKDHFRYVKKIDTTNLAPIDGARQVARESLTALQNLLDEEILVIDQNKLSAFDFSKGIIWDNSTVSALADCIMTNHYFMARKAAEINTSTVQVIPSAVIEHESKVMLLRRSERDAKDRLHKKYAIWAGGHCRSQDKEVGGNVIEAALERELDEELFIKTQHTKRLIAFTYDQGNPRSRLHLGAIYRLEVASPEVYLALDQQEFKEKRGLSVSGRFFTPHNIIANHFNDLEAWSRSLLVHFYNISPPPEGTLFDLSG